MVLTSLPRDGAGGHRAAGGSVTTKRQSQDDTPPPREDVRDYLARLLGTAAFPASPRRRKLLEYVVEQTLAGRADRLKAFDLAVAVLGRDERFDAQNDPIVRIEVGRLRRDLERYYEVAGRDDPIRITIPKGHYIPAFETRGEATTPADLRPRRTVSGRATCSVDARPWPAGSVPPR